MSAFLSETKIVYNAGLRSAGSAIYWIIILLVIAAFSSLPFIHLDITVKAAGIIRPINERTELRSIQTGIIDSIFYREGDTVSRNDVVLQLQNRYLIPKVLLNDYEILQTQESIHDLEVLTTIENISDFTLKSLKSPVYKQQASRFILQKTEQEFTLKKMDNEIEINRVLIKDRIIAPKEQFDKLIESQKLRASFKTLLTEQKSIWLQQLSTYKLQYSALEMQQKQLQEESSLYQVKAPISGILFGINPKYPGGLVQSGETFCIISPESELIAECFISTRDIGLLKLNQLARFQIDAFDHYFFGFVTGRIVTIDNDFTSINDKSVFKIRCFLDSSQLFLKNGFKGKLKKGLTLQARFIVARRTAWQLLFDKLDNWIDPV
ncbi:MAG: HlyD family secretion protein [Flavitalea sp.]